MELVLVTVDIVVLLANAKSVKENQLLALDTDLVNVTEPVLASLDGNTPTQRSQSVIAPLNAQALMTKNVLDMEPVSVVSVNVMLNG